MGHPHECWEYQGRSVGSAGHGTICIGERRTMQVHRLAFELEYGPIPKGLFVLHSCDNGPCCNPEHLSIGTQADNMRDAASRNRLSHGVNHVWAKLSEEDVREIRATYASGEYSQSDLAEMYACRQGTISNIINSRTWRHLDPAPIKPRQGPRFGSAHPCTALTEADVLHIRKSVAKNEHTKAYFAKLHDVAHRTIRDITNRVTWKHLSITIEELAPVKRELTPEEAQDIRTRLASGETQLSLAREYGMATTSMNRLARGIPGKYYGRP